MNRAPAITLDELRATLKRYGCGRTKAKYLILDREGNAMAGADNEFHAHLIKRALINSGHVMCRIFQT